MQVTGDKNQISDDVFDLMISYLPFPRSQSVLNLLNFFPSVYKDISLPKLQISAFSDLTFADYMDTKDS